MTGWTPDELTKIGGADELEVASLRRDGTLTNPRIVWVVRDGDEVYVRSVNGPDAAWFRSTRARHEGHIRAGGVERDVTFVDTTDVNQQADAAYRGKYRSWTTGLNRITSPMRPRRRMRLVPR
jgi:hypothetical protein